MLITACLFDLLPSSNIVNCDKMTTLNFNSQLRYLLQWFNEWSELQRSDFLPILAENYAHKAYVNGIVNSISNMNCRDKPMSLFECRIKLFKEWFTQWNVQTKDAFLKKIAEIDPEFVDKLNAKIEETDINEANNVENDFNNE